MDTPHTSYSCHAFHDSLPGGRASGSLRVSQKNLRFTIGSGAVQQTLDLPMASLQMEMGGASKRLIFITHPRYPDWRFYTSERHFLKDPHLNQSPAGATLQRARNHHRKAWSLFALVAAVIIALPLLLVFRMDWVSSLVAQQIPAEWEQTLGKSTVAQYQIGKRFMAEEEASRLLQPLVQPLLDARDSRRYDYDFNIVHDASINAFALPGGQVVIHSALILEAESAEELLGVLAHEMIHIEQQHGLRNVIGMAGIYLVAAAVIGDVSGILATISSAAPILINQSYSRKFETQADELGFALLHKANIDPSGLARFFVRLKKQEEEQMAKIENEEAREIVRQAMAYVSTHPATDKRINNLEKLSKTHDTSGRTLVLDEEFAALKLAVKEFANTPSADQSDTQSIPESTTESEPTQGEIKNDEK